MRSVDTRFWKDTWVRKLNALDRYAFLYFLTNTHTTWCGVYELDISMAAFESGIDERDLLNTIIPRLSPKIIYVDNWVYVKNWTKYHLSGNGSMSPQQKKGMEDAWKLVPPSIVSKIDALSTEEIPYTEGMGGVSASASASAITITSASAIAITSASAIASEGSEAAGSVAYLANDKVASGTNVNNVISLFVTVDPKNKTNYKNNTQRDAAAFLITEYGLEEVRGRIATLSQTNGKPFFPTITTPLQLKEKWVALDSAVKRYIAEDYKRLTIIG